MARKLDRLTPQNATGTAFVRLWQRNCEIAEANNADLQSQIDAITNLNSDNVLTPGKKPVWIFMYSFLTGERAALDTEATTFGVTTEKTTYDNAVSALTTYLGTLTTPVLWNDLTGNTTIVGTTFRSKFNDVLVDKQALLNKLHDTSRSLANAAQSTATTANSTANTAKRDAAIGLGWTSPGSLLTSSDNGTNADIIVASHTRNYGDGTSASVTGATITAPYGTLEFIYYDDANRSGGAVTFHKTTNPNTAANNAATGRHYCGQVTTAAAGGAPTTGGGTLPPGGDYTGPTEIP